MKQKIKEYIRLILFVALSAVGLKALALQIIFQGEKIVIKANPSLDPKIIIPKNNINEYLEDPKTKTADTANQNGDGHGSGNRVSK